jgi:topoisomerase-4 subunit A
MQMSEQSSHEAVITQVSGMYREWFLDYASYVILERAVPHIHDGFKPVQRRLLHSMRDLEDGRYHKVANLIGHTMKYHPHGDASIGDALVQLGQKDLLVDTQGNWGNTLTGDGAAAPRYIEARLSKFALEVVYSPKITTWQLSYDGRGKEPVTLPVKFPMLLTSGIEGIAVGLSTKIMPHNFVELIDASIKVLRGKKAEIFPDFPTGGIADFSDYQDGQRGSGRIKIRARIETLDKSTLKIAEIPFGTTTSSLIDSILKANDKGKIKVKRIEDNTANEVEILVHLHPGISPDQMIDALYAFTDCEVSISPNCCVIEDEKPHFLGVSEVLERSTHHTLGLLKSELEIELQELQEQWHFANLEKIFIENRIYRDIEEEETWEGVISAIHKGLKPHIAHLTREVTDDDVARLTEIRIKRISKFDIDRANQQIEALEEKIEHVKFNLNNLVDYAVDYFKNLKKKYGVGRERRTEIRKFDDIQATQVAMTNEKLYINREEGFVGTSLKKDEFVEECSDLDDVITILEDGTMMVTKVDKKTFVGKNIIHAAVWKKGDDRTIYNMVYRDGVSGVSYVKRFAVTSITREKPYALASESKGSKVLYLSVNPNGEAEKIHIYLRNLKRLKKTSIHFDFADIAIKGRSAKGNILSKQPIKKIELKDEGISTLGAQEVWFDSTVLRLNTEGRGDSLGFFSGDDRILEINSKGMMRLLSYDVTTHFDDDAIVIEKLKPEIPISAIYLDASKQRYYVKRFIPEIMDKSKRVSIIPEEEGNQLEWVSTDFKPRVELEFVKAPGKDRKPNVIINLEEFIDVKGIKAIGNQLTRDKVKSINPLEPESMPETQDVSKELLETNQDVSEPEESVETNTNEPGSSNKPPSITGEGQISLEL